MKTLITLCTLMVSTFSYAGTVSHNENATKMNSVSAQSYIHEIIAPLTEEENYVEQNYDQIYIRNKCYKTLQVAVIFNDLEGDWSVRAWMQIAPGERVYAARTQNASFYFYAESMDNQMKWSGDNYFTIQGGQFGFIQKYTNIEGWGTFTQNLLCN